MNPLRLLLRVFGPEASDRTVLPRLPYFGGDSTSHERWKCERDGHVFAPGDIGGCCYCSEIGED